MTYQKQLNQISDMLINGNLDGKALAIAIMCNGKKHGPFGSGAVQLATKQVKALQTRSKYLCPHGGTNKPCNCTF